MVPALAASTAPQEVFFLEGRRQGHREGCPPPGDFKKLPSVKLAFPYSVVNSPWSAHTYFPAHLRLINLFRH